jgi:hypothetical protein
MREKRRLTVCRIERDRCADCRRFSKTGRSRAFGWPRCERHAKPLRACSLPYAHVLGGREQKLITAHFRLEEDPENLGEFLHGPKAAKDPAR